ncbi:MAG: pilus assembly protein N-terminal domain-containing protein [bacterium]
MNPIRKTIPRTVGAITILMLLMVMPQAFGQDRVPAITDLAIRPDTNQVELVVLGKIEYGYFPLSHPERLVFDFPGATLYYNRGASTDRDIEGAAFTKVRLSQFSADPPIARLVLYLSEPATAVVDYSREDGIFKINTMTEKETQVPDPGIRTVRRNLLTPVKSGTPAVTVKPEDQYVISNTDSDVLIRFPFLDAGKITVNRLNFPDRLHVRMYTNDIVETERPRFEPLKRGNIWNSIGKQWVSYIDRDDLGIIDLTIYLYPDVKYSQTINDLGIPEVRLFILTGEESESANTTSGEINDAGSLFVVSEEDLAIAIENSENNGTDDIVSTEEIEVEVLAEGSKPNETVITDAVETLEIIDNGKFGIESGNDVKISLNEPHILPTTGAGLPAIPTITRSNLIGSGMSAEDGTLFLKVGDVVVVRVSGLVRASVGNPDVAALNVISQAEILITAMKPGSTTLLTWEGENNHVVRQINVLNSTFTSEEEIRQVIDDDSIEVKIVMSGDSPGVVLEGSVKTEEESKRAEKIAALYAGEARVSNLIEITAPRQVLVKVRVVEIDKRALEERLSQFSAAGRTDNDDFTFGILTNLLDPENPGGGLINTRTRPGIINGTAEDMIYDPVDIMLNDLESNREGRVLSEPNVVAMSGHKAHFRVGGEVPYTYQNSNGVNVVEFREFGITLDMTPNVDSLGNIRLDVKPIVKSVDMALAIAGIPGFKTREMETSVQLKTGESLVIGGLIQRELSEVVSKVPFLADIPILGELFKSRKFNENKTELVIFLTPYIIENLDASERIITTGMKILNLSDSEDGETEKTTEQ